MFSTEERPARVVHVCDDIACKVAGAEDLIGDLERELGSERENQLLRSPCLGMCERAPAALMQTFGNDASDTAMGPVSMEFLDPFLHGGPWTMMSGAEAAEVAPQTRRGLVRASACSGASASSIRPRSTTTGRTAATRRFGGRSSSVPRA